MDQIIEEDGKENTFDQIGPSTSNGGIMNKTALDILLKMIRKEMGNIQMGIGPPKAEQCPQQNVQELCDEKSLWNALMGHGFLIIFCLAIVGNCLNLFIYNSDQIRFFIAIRMLCTKLLMNTLMMVVMLPQAFRGIHLWEIGSAMDKIYWRFWPYQAYLTNVFGFCAMWLTVLMTAECYVHIFFPSKSKVLCTKKTVWRGYLLILLTALILASIYPLNRNISFTTKCQKMIVKIVTSQHPFMQFLEKIHAIADLLLAILIPLSLLVFMTIMIVWRLWVWPIRHFRQQNASSSSLNPTPPPSSTNLLLTKNATKIERKTIRGKHFAAEKRGVTRITLITCCIQLITETPSMSVLIYATMFGPNVHKKAAYFDICSWQTISYFLCLCNASLSFFVYITFSTRFRQTMTNRAQLILHRFCPSLFKEAASAFSQKGRRHQPMPNSSCTSHSHLAIMSSKNESPRKSSPNINERITSPNLFIVKK